MAGYKQHSRFQIKAIVDINRQAAEKFNADHNLNAAIYTDYNEMLKTEQPEFVSICLWTQMHKQVAEDCCKAGAAGIHCEKPMATTWADAMEMAAFAKETSVQLTHNHQRRFRQNYRTAKELLDAGHIGQLESFDVYIHANVLDMGSHLLDLMNMYNNENPVKWVMGQIDAREIKEWFGIPFEFAACASVRFENNVRASIHVGDDNSATFNFGIRLTGSQGIMEVITEEDLRILQYGQGTWDEKHFDKGENEVCMKGVMADILAGLDGERTPELSAANALHATEIIFAIYESSRSRSRIDLPLKTGDSAFATMLTDGTIG